MKLDSGVTIKETKIISLSLHCSTYSTAITYIIYTYVIEIK